MFSQDIYHDHLTLTDKDYHLMIIRGSVMSAATNYRAKYGNKHSENCRYFLVVWFATHKALICKCSQRLNFHCNFYKVES